MTSENCASCQEALIIEVEPDSDAEDSKAGAQNAYVLDDVELSCGCHYHWECFMESYTITQCPSCDQDISSLSPKGQQQVLCTVRNEGGEQKNFDILPSATDEAYLRAYPEESKGRAFLDFCREGDLDAIICLIRDEDESSEEEPDVLRYQGSFEGIEGSGLHVAVRYAREDVAWLLLALASELEWSQFPDAVLQEMARRELSKEDRRAGTDIRSLQDNEGRTSLTLARELGGPWQEWASSGRLSA